MATKKSAQRPTAKKEAVPDQAASDRLKKATAKRPVRGAKVSVTPKQDDPGVPPRPGRKQSMSPKQDDPVVPPRPGGKFSVTPKQDDPVVPPPKAGRKVVIKLEDDPGKKKTGKGKPVAPGKKKKADSASKKVKTSIDGKNKIPVKLPTPGGRKPTIKK